MKRPADNLFNRVVRSRCGSPPTLTGAAPGSGPPLMSTSTHLLPPVLEHATSSSAAAGFSSDPTASHVWNPNQFSDFAVLSNARPQPSPGVSFSALPPQSKKDRVLGGLKTLVQIVDKKAEAFAPIGFAMGDLLDCLNTYECEADSRKAYETLLTELEALLDTLTWQFGGPMPPQMTASIASLSMGIRKEVAYARDKCNRRRMRRYAEATGDSEDILNCYRRIQRLLSQLSMNANLEMWRIVDIQVAEGRLERMPMSRAARYNSAESTGLLRGKCTPNTRRNIVGTLHSWVDRSDDLNVYWLNGMAGTGKTTIAYSFCAERDQIHSLGASFFCSRSSATCSDATLIVPTIAYQLALFSHPFRSVLCKLLGEELDICNRDVTTQFQRMIVDTLTNTRDSVPENTLVVIDALDECSNQQEVGLLLDALLKHAPQLPIKFFVASRAEGTTQSRMMRHPTLRSVFYLHEVEESFVQEDIELYVTAELSPISPSPEQVTLLVQQAGRLFIYAATIIRYVKRNDFDDSSLDRLDRILRLTNSDKIDGLYTAILSAAFYPSDLKLDEEERTDMLNALHAVVCAREPLTVDALGALLRPGNPCSLRTALKPFHSVLHVSEASSLVTTLHASFPDYLFNKQRSGGFYCDFSQENGRLAHACLDKIVSINPPFNICGLESSYDLDEDVPDLAERISRAIPLELFYACSYWARHVEVGGELAGLKGPVSRFLSSHLLVWMEVMNLKKCMDVGVQLLSRTRQWCQKCAHDNMLIDLIRDAYNFVTLFTNGPASCSTPHIYISMLPFWPSNAPVSVHYRTRVRGLVEASGTAIASGPSALLGKWFVGDQINCLAISPDGSHLAIATGKSLTSRGFAISVWTTHTGQKRLGPLGGHLGLIRSISYSPDGMHVISGSNDKTIRVWCASTGQVTIGPLEGHSDMVTSVAYSPDGAHIVSGSHDHTIRVWDASTGHIAHILAGHNNPALSVVYLREGSFIAFGGRDEAFCIWDPHTGQMVHRSGRSYIQGIKCLAYSPDGAQIVSCTEDGRIDLWDAFMGEEPIRRLVSHAEPVYKVAYSPDGKCITSLAYDGIYIWDAQTGEKISGPFEADGSPSSYAFSPDSARIICGSDDGMISVWDVHARIEDGRRAETDDHRASSVAYSPDGTRIVSDTDQGTLCVWDAYTGHKILGPLEGHTEFIRSVAYSPDGSRIVSGSADRTLLVWDAETGRRVLGPLNRHTDQIHSVSYTPDGSRIVTGSSDHTICTWDSHSGELVLGPLLGHTEGVCSITCSPDSAHIASGSSDRTICVWEISTGQTVRILEGHSSVVSSVAYSPTGEHIASGSWDCTLCIWNANTGEMEVGPIQWHTDYIDIVAYSPDGAYIASGSWDGTICMWDACTGDMAAGPFRALRSPKFVSSVAFSPDGTRILYCSDSTIGVWCPNQITQGAEAEWELDEDGWVVDSMFRWLLWIPPAFQDDLLTPCKPLQISPRGTLSLNFDRARLGYAWTDIFTVD